MIEVASYPPELAAWDQGEHPFYLEVFGETEPFSICRSQRYCLRGAKQRRRPRAHQSTSIGGRSDTGQAPEHHHLWPERPSEKPIWSKLDDIAARVYLYFPINAGWRIKELVATVKYLSPVHDQTSWSAAAAEEWTKLQPLMEDAGNLASKLGPIPGVGTVAAGAAPILSTLAKLKIGSVPQGVKGFDWSVGKVTFGSKKNVGSCRALCGLFRSRCSSSLAAASQAALP